MSVIKLIMSDIDGTILDQNHQLDSHLLELMPLLKQSEIPFVLASARSPLGIAPISKELGITDCTKWLFCENQQNCDTTTVYKNLQKWFNWILKLYTLDKIAKNK